MKSRRIAIVALAVLGVTAGAHAQQQDFGPGLYGIDSRAPATMYRIDPLSGEATPVVPVNASVSLAGFSFLDRTAYATDIDIFDASSAAEFGSFDTVTGAVTVLSDQDGSSNWHGLASNETAGVLYTIDLENTQLKVQHPDGTIVPIGAGSGIRARGMAYDDTNGILYATGPEFPSDSLYTVDTTTGIADLVGPLGITTAANGLAYDENAGVLYMNATGPSTIGPTSLYIVDTSDGSATLVGPNLVNSIDGLAWFAGDPARIPTASEWGLIVLALLLLVAGTIFVRRARVTRAVT